MERSDMHFQEASPASAPPRSKNTLDRDLEGVEALLRELSTGRRLDRLGAALWEHIDTGGKRLRARLALGTLESLGGRREDAIPWAAACEMLHNASLVHDDLQDGDHYRRGRPALWSRYGMPLAVNGGDLGLMLAYRAVEFAQTNDACRYQMVRALARTAEQVVRGQDLELHARQRLKLTWNAWLEASMGKTAALFALPVHGAALLAGLPPEPAENLAAAFRPIGVLFQIQDDVLDLFGEKGRDVMGSDVREGKISALVVEHLRLHPEQRAWLLNILRIPRAETTDADVHAVRDAIENGGAIPALWERMRGMEAQTLQALRHTPHLRRVAQDLISRALAPIAHTERSLS